MTNGKNPRRWRAVVVATATALAGLLAAQAPAYAATRYVDVAVHQDPQWDYGQEWFAIVTMAAGDCVETSGYVELLPPDAQGSALIHWNTGSLLTHHTNHADVWHQRFEFKTAFGTTVLSAGGFDGPQMTQINKEYTGTYWQRVTIDPQLYPLITTVRWIGDC
jgi:hypothetical protein